MPRASEVVIYIKASMEFGEFTKEEKQNISKELINIAEQKINDGLSFINREIEKRFNEKQMGTFTVQPIHQTGRILIQMEVGKQYRAALTDNFELIEVAYQISPTKENIEKLFENMNKVFIHSKANQNYFGALNELTEENKRINNYWNNAKAKLSQIFTANNETAFIESNAGHFKYPVDQRKFYKT